MKRSDFALVGGGIVGACLAEELAATGAAVTVLDAGPAPGHATSRAAGPAAPAPRYAADHVFHGWLRQAAHSLRDDVDRLEPVHHRFSAPQPILHALRPEDADRLSPHLPAADTAAQWISPAQAADLAPDLRLPDDRRYLLEKAALAVDGARYLAAVRAGCARLGVDWRQDTTVRDVLNTGDGVELATTGGPVRTDIAIITAGAWSGAAELTGRSVHVRPRREQLVTLTAGSVPSVILSAAHRLTPGVTGDVIAATGADTGADEAAGFDDRCDVAGITALLRFAAAAMPALARAAPADLRCGLSPAPASGRPLIGRVPGHQRLWLATGHAGHGLLTARHTARGLTTALTKGQWDTVPRMMCPTRALEG
ncbi:NAD(P)/FAD-dependent oxidoreductase [Actinomadura chibensis]|uniref:FAD-binding oxidoreductase n=1 Tax=Actinomadura chibensis TaxID=392828 RepID=A0A5D0NHR8_9ACTN|nr:FAD-dependent oxidoreductase [Actinomadura chibensis]TYB43976.1 FAD-binding oxidoreductase [Actinomadura chibensis]